MEHLISAAARALAAGDAVSALKVVGQREDPPAMALRGIAMAQLGDLVRARELLRSAARAFGPRESRARARCKLAEAEIALVSRDLAMPTRTLLSAREALAACGDAANAAHAGYLEARRLLLIGRLGEAAGMLASVVVADLPVASLAGYSLVAAGIAMRRIRAAEARGAIENARRAARMAGIASLVAEVERAAAALEAPAARLTRAGESRLVSLAAVEALAGSEGLVVDASRGVVRSGEAVVPLAGRPVLFALARALAEAWPGDVPRETLIERAFRGREADETHRARLRVEIGRLRGAVAPLANILATRRGFTLIPLVRGDVAVLAPPVESEHGDVLALLADGEAWSSSSLALALGVSPRTVQRAMERLASNGEVAAIGHGRARRWLIRGVPGFPTGLLLPVAVEEG